MHTLLILRALLLNCFDFFLVALLNDSSDGLCLVVNIPLCANLALLRLADTSSKIWKGMALSSSSFVVLFETLSILTVYRYHGKCTKYTYIILKYDSMNLQFKQDLLSPNQSLWHIQRASRFDFSSAWSFCNKSINFYSVFILMNDSFLTKNYA